MDVCKIGGNKKIPRDRDFLLAKMVDGEVQMLAESLFRISKFVAILALSLKYNYKKQQSSGKNRPKF